ncbi:MAG: hypothetical protein PHF35_00500 [Candidatus Moranbacteria bacterium]|nr:hypothetical protein [Candidatus Moranbacteria bacterium]
MLLLVIFISLLVSLATCRFATPNVFGGRDQGSIATAAIYLSENHQLTVDLPVAHDLFQKYGPGKALNFPGFDYQKDGTLVSRFPVGYTSYLAAYYDLFGLKGLQYANLLPLFLFLVVFWLILDQFFDASVSFFGFLLAASFFPFLWFAKFSLTETYMLFLVWTGIYFMIRWQQQLGNLVSKSSLFFALAFFALSSLVRIEGIVFFFLALSYIFLLERKEIIKISINIKKYLLISTIFLLIIYFYLNFPDLLDSGKNLVKAFLPGSGKESAPSASLYGYIFRVFFNYNLLAYLILGLAGIFWLGFRYKKNWTKPEFLPIFITWPLFFYLLSPMISLDDPWMLRRFVFAVFPALLIYSIWALRKFFYHKIFLYLVLIILLAANMVVSRRFIDLSENQALLEQTKNISNRFSDNDLVLVDRLATGSGYSLLSEPLRTLYGKNAVYFFNAEDLKYLDESRYEHIHLIAPFSEEKTWYSDLIKDKKFEFNLVVNNFIEPAEQKWALAQNVESKDFFGIWTLK